MPDPRLRGLYVLTRAGDDLLEKSSAALRGGARLVQYRDKSDDTERRLDEARQLRALCTAASATFIVNDDIDLAIRVEADGVHLGRDDAGIADARAALGDTAIIGVSCYDSLERAEAAAGADYLAFGAFFPSPTKPDAVRAAPALLTAARETFGLPLCAIGGITPENGAELVVAGADMLAVISGVFDADDADVAAGDYARLFR